MGVSEYALEQTGNEEDTSGCQVLKPASELWKPNMHQLSTTGQEESETGTTETWHWRKEKSNDWQTPGFLVHQGALLPGWVCQPLKSPWWGPNMEEKNNINYTTETDKSKFQYYKIVNTAQFLQNF